MCIPICIGAALVFSGIKAVQHPEGPAHHKSDGPVELCARPAALDRAASGALGFVQCQRSGGFADRQVNQRGQKTKDDRGPPHRCIILK